MRKNFVIALIITVLVACSLSCNRYENGPAFTLRTTKSRIVGEWKLVDLLVNDIHDEILFDGEASSVFELNSDGTYNYSVNTFKIQVKQSGTWVFNDDKTELILTINDGVNEVLQRDYKITRLSNTEMWLVDESLEYSGMTEFIERRFEKIEN